MGDFLAVRPASWTSADFIRFLHGVEHGEVPVTCAVGSGEI